MRSAVSAQPQAQAAQRGVLVADIVQGTLTVAQASRQLGVPHAEVESWLSQHAPSLKRASGARIRYPDALREAYCEAMLELPAHRNLDCFAHRNFQVISVPRPLS